MKAAERRVVSTVANRLCDHLRVLFTGGVVKGSPPNSKLPELLIELFVQHIKDLVFLILTNSGTIKIIVEN